MSIKVNTRTNKVEATTFPAVISTVAAGNVDYKVYGNTDGVGEQTANIYDKNATDTDNGYRNNYALRASGYQIPLTVESGEESTTIPIYIGDSKLMAEEYVDYEEQKVYKRTENLFDMEAGKMVPVEEDTFRFGNDLGVLPAETYTFVFQSTTSSRNFYITAFDGETYSSSNYISRNAVKTFTADGVKHYYLRTNASNAESYAEIGVTSAFLTVGSSVPDPIPPYFQPTDPPVALPELSTYQGENTLSFETTVQPEKLELTSASSNLLKEETITKILRTEDDGQGTVNEHILYDATN